MKSYQHAETYFNVCIVDTIGFFVKFSWLLKHILCNKYIESILSHIKTLNWEVSQCLKHLGILSALNMLWSNNFLSIFFRLENYIKYNYWNIFIFLRALKAPVIIDRVQDSILFTFNLQTRFLAITGMFCYELLWMNLK